MAEEYLRLLDEARKKLARGEDASDLIPKIAEVLAKMTKDAREKALKSPGLTPEEADNELGALWLEATLAWIAVEAIAIVGAYVPLTNAAPVLAKAFDAPELKWRVDAAMQGIALKTEARLHAPLRRFFNKTYLPNIIDARTAIELHKRQIFDDTLYREVMTRWGYGSIEADNFAIAARALPTYQEVVRMAWRGISSLPEAVRWAQVGGYAEGDAKNLVAIQEPIPGSGDLINFVVKEAFPLANLSAAPAEFTMWMAKQGYSADWCKAYWHAHWRLVPEGTVLDLWHRGFISAEEATKYLVLHDFPTSKRPGQSKTDTEMVLENSYSLLPRIDLRFGWFTGTLTEDDMKALYGKYGYKTEDAVKEITIQKARVLEIYRRSYLSTLQLAYRRGKITADAFRSKIVAEKFPAEVADWLIKSEDLRIALGAGVESVSEERALTPSTLTRLYRRDIIDQARLKTELANMNYSAAEISLLIADADYSAPVEAKETRKLIGVSDLENMYKRGLKTRDAVIGDLKFRHYEEPDYSSLLQIWDAEIAAAKVQPRTLIAVSELEKLYKAGARSKDQLKGDLLFRNWQEPDIGTQLDVWDREVKAQLQPAPTPEPAKTISAAEALEAFEKGLKDEAWTRAQLTAQNYAVARIDLLIQAARAKMKVAVVGYKGFTLGDIEKFYKNKQMDKVNARANLRQFPYAEGVITTYLDLWDIEMAKAAPPSADYKAKLSLSELQFAWENGLITDTSLSDRIGAMNYSAEDAVLMAQLTKARALENERNRLMSITESRFKVGLGTEAEARAFMSSLGYISERQNIIIGAWIMERDLGIVTDTRDAWLKAYSKGQDRTSVRGYLTQVLKLDPGVVDALLLLEDAKLLKA